MKNKILIGGLMVMCIVLFSFIQKRNSGNIEIKNNKNAGNGIEFIEENWSKALQQAKDQHKLIFLDAYASWCGPCKLLKNLTFPNKEAGDFFNKNFINVSVNMEKGMGPILVEKFQVTAYPTLVIADANGNIVTYTRGYIGPKELIKFGEYALKINK